MKAEHKLKNKKWERLVNEATIYDQTLLAALYIVRSYMYKLNTLPTQIGNAV